MYGAFNFSEYDLKNLLKPKNPLNPKNLLKPKTYICTWMNNDKSVLKCRSFVRF